MSIVLTSKTYVITTINRKTRAEGFRDWRVGDFVRFHTEMESAGRASGGGVYASTFEAENVTQGTVITKSQTQMAGMFGKRGTFEIQPAVVRSNEAGPV